VSLCPPRVLYDALDPLLLEAFEAQPTNLSPVGALRATMRQIGGAPADVLAQQDERAALIFTVPELRMRMLDEFARSMLLFADVVAKRVGRRPDDLAVRALVGAVVGGRGRRPPPAAAPGAGGAPPWAGLWSRWRSRPRSR
jgi:hypothetical protein